MIARRQKRLLTTGYTLLEIMLVLAIIGLLAALAIPGFIKNRQESHRVGCINNLRKLDTAKEEAAMSMGWTNGIGVSFVDTTWKFGVLYTNYNVVMEYIRSTDPICPSKGSYSFNPIGSNPVCSLAIDPTLHIMQR